jgi:hypothetical protein
MRLKIGILASSKAAILLGIVKKLLFSTNTGKIYSTEDLTTWTSTSNILYGPDVVNTGTTWTTSTSNL